MESYQKFIRPFNHDIFFRSDKKIEGYLYSVSNK